MTEPEVRGRRALVLGAETELGAAIAGRLAGTGAALALVAATPDAAAAFAVQRLARRLSAFAQAIDATNEMALRVMVRQVGKRLGGLDALLVCAEPGGAAFDLACRYGGREIVRSGGGVIVAFGAPAPPVEPELPPGVRLLTPAIEGKTPAQAADEALALIAARGG